MNKLSPSLLLTLFLLILLTAPGGAWADSPQQKTDVQATAPEKTPNGDDTAADSPQDKTTAKTPAKPKPTKFKTLLKDATPIEGLIKLYRKDTKLYGELPAKLLDTDFIVIISIARGIGERPLLGGAAWSFGDDWIWQFRKADNRIQIVRRNVRFRAAKGSPQAKAVHLAYTDSVLFSLPIAATAGGGASVVDLTPVFKSDLPQISQVLKGFSFSKDKSSWASVKGFKDNVEIQVAATYSSSGTTSFDTVADSRGLTINVHYSISKLPVTGYQPRLADDRVGYFLTVVKDYSKTVGYDRFVRYINRWDLRKAEPSAKLSPPKKPIIFWIEKTVPFKYRKPVREGISEWNKAFEKAGLVNAIEVRQQPDDATWDPEDINYNTFRWITSSAGFAMGPSRVNPTTGQILDADIILDADYLNYWKEEYEVVTSEGLGIGDWGLEASAPPTAYRLPPTDWCRCRYTQGMARQLAFSSIMLAEGAKPASKEQIEKLLTQGVKAVVMHEVGHTLGLRHNFKASAFLSLEELNDPEKAQNTGLAASVMDYLPVNLVPGGQKQGPYFNIKIGPYDYWAIEYGYSPPDGQQKLNKIASRCAEAALQYGTDEDTRGFDPDPLCARYDLGKDPIKFARQRVALVNQAWPGLVERMTPKGENYHRARRAFNILLSEYGSAMYFAGRFIGGVYVHRDHKGDPDARPPYVIVPLEKQREAMTFLEEQAFGRQSYQYPPELYNHLGHSNWSHWGTRILPRVDYPIHEIILAWQDRVLAQLLSPVTLSRLVDSELKVPAQLEAFTAAELLERLSGAIFSETEAIKEGKYTNRKPAIGALRRSLQRRYLQRLSGVAMGNTPAPEDCQAVAYAQLKTLEGRIKQVLSGKAQLDTYTRAHLNEAAESIRKVLDARLQLRRP